MDRRKFIECMALLPTFSALGAFGVEPLCSKDCESKTRVVRVALQGPFAVVIHKDQANAIEAFIPKDESHQFFLNRFPFPGGPFVFTMKPDTLKIASAPCVHPSFEKFCYNSVFNPPSPANRLLTLKAPCPSRITLGSIPLSAHFMSEAEASNGATMPVDHVLEYELKDGANVATITADPGGDHSVSLNMSIVFAVGLPLGTPSAKAIQHAIEFHNGSLLSSFPKIKDDPHYRLRSIIPALISASDVDCKNGGMIVTTP